MDIFYITGQEKFNYRVCAVIVHEKKLLAMRDERSPYSYLPGGRVRMGETAEQAVLRELKEELDIRAKILRPLWLSQSFFREDVDKLNYHELCLYFLIDENVPHLLEQGQSFSRREGRHTHKFEWLEFSRLENEYFYPIFLKKEIFRLPEQFTLRADYE